MTTDTTPTHSTLEPCPFCGGPGKLINTMGERISGAKEPPYYGPQRRRVVCASLYEDPIRGCPERNVFDTEAEAIAAWNTRSQPTDRADTAGLDNCELCLGAKGGVPGNENRIGGKVVCDYCTSFIQSLRQAPAPADGVEAESAALRDMRELLRQTANALACADKNDPNECIADNGMTVWDGMRAEHERLWPQVTAALTKDQSNG